jgi:hypothetical protein
MVRYMLAAAALVAAPLLALPASSQDTKPGSQATPQPTPSQATPCPMMSGTPGMQNGMMKNGKTMMQPSGKGQPTMGMQGGVNCPPTPAATPPATKPN